MGTSIRMKTRSHFPLKFFALAFGISWLLWLPGVLGGPVLTELAVFGPSAAGFALAWREGRGAGVRDLFKRVLNWRIPIRWLAVIVLLPAGLFVLTLWLVGLFTGDAATGWQVPEFLPHPLFIIPYFLYTLVFHGPLGEEFGWRGYALDRLQARWSPLTASIILGAFWGVWHLPLFFTSGSLHAESLPIVWFVFSTIPLSILITWIYNSTGGNLLTAVLFHQMINFGLELNPTITSQPTAFAILVSLFTVSAVVVGLVWLKRGTNRLAD